MRHLVQLGLALLALCPSAPAGAGEPPADPSRTPPVWRAWHPRWRHLALQPGLTLYRRTLAEAGTDPYPYVLVASEEQRRASRALPVRAEAFGEVVTRASLSTQAGALEALAFFLPAQVVPTREAAQRIRAEARRLAPELKESSIREQGAQALDAYAGPVVVRRGDGTFEARFLALATDLELTLESVTGTVDPARGVVTLERTALIQGPPTFWLVCGTGRTPEQLAEDEARRTSERDLVRRALRAALAPGRTREAARALAREGVTFAQVTSALGEPDDDVGSGLHVWVFALDEGVLLVGEAGSVRWMRLAPGHPGSPFPRAGEPESIWPPP